MLFGQMDLAINGLGIVTQLVVTGALLSRLGLVAGLALLPILTALGFAGLAAAPMLWVVVAFQVLRRGLHFAVDRPAKENLFTVVTREQKYKAKSFIDNGVYRGGDALSGWAYQRLRDALSLSGTALVGVPLALAWLGCNLYLARRHKAKEAES